MFLVAIVSVVALAFGFSASAQDTAPGVEIKKIAPRAKAKEKEPVVRITGALSPSDPRDRVRTTCYSKQHLHKMDAGKIYIIELNQIGPTRWDPYLRLENSTGTQLKEDDDGGGNLNSRVVFTPSVSDEYKIIMTSCSGPVTGEYELKITTLPPGATIPGFGMPVNQYAPAEIGDIVVTAEPLLCSTMNDNNTSFGYVEYRFIIENNSPKDAHQVTITLPHSSYGGRGDRYLASIKRTVNVGPEGQATVSLFQPFLPLGSSGSARVTVDGVDKDGANSVSINLLANRGRQNGGFGYGGPPRVKSTVPTPGGATNPYIPVLYNVSDEYGIGNAALTWAQDKNREIEEKNLELDPDKIKGPMPVLPLDQPFWLFQSSRPTTEWSKVWLGYTPFAGIALPGKALDAAPAEVRNAIFQWVECGGGLLLIDKARLPAGWDATKSTKGDVTHYFPGFGQCIVTPPEKLNADRQLGKDVTKMWMAGYKAFDQTADPTEANRRFPVVESTGVPIRSLFLVMIAFVVLIGPVNIVWLARTNRRIWLLWTVPVFSLLTSVALFGFMALTEGWHGHVRVQAITVLDENSRHAASIGWLGYYSPTTLGALRFGYQTELTPHLDAYSTHMYGYRSGGSQPLAMDWNDGQNLTSGWVTAKVPMHFLTRKSETQDLRILFRKKGGSPIVVNALKADIATLWLADADGTIWTATDVAAGPEVSLRRADKKAEIATPASLRDAYGASWLTFAQRLEENPERFLRPGTYLAIMNESPFLETGLSEAQSRNQRSIVFGVMKQE